MQRFFQMEHTQRTRKGKWHAIHMSYYHDHHRVTSVSLVNQCFSNKQVIMSNITNTRNGQLHSISEMIFL